MKARLYYAIGGETLKDVAEKTGVDYAQIVRLNKAFVHSKLYKNAGILLGYYDNKWSKKTETETGNENADEEKKAKETAAAAKKAEQNAAAARKKAAQRQEALAAIDVAEKEFSQNSAYVNADHTQKVSRLTELMRNNRNKMEGDLARQKIADSSIAQSERNRLIKQEADEKAAIDLQTTHKLEELERKKTKTKDTQNRKLANL